MLSLFKKDRDFFDSLFDEFRVAPFGNDVSMRTDIKEMNMATNWPLKCLVLTNRILK